MQLSDILISVALLLLVMRQIRPRSLNDAGLLWPVPLVLYAAWQNLHDLPSGPDLQFALLLAGVGLLLGLGCGATTQVYRRNGQVMAHATGLAVILWLIGISARLLFAFAAQHGAAEAIGKFSAAHQLTMNAWIAGLIGMSLAEVLGRSGLLLWRRGQLT